MREEKPYAYIEEVASSLKNDGLPEIAEKLLHVHEGIFNGTEAFMAWRWNIEEILKNGRISGATRKSAIRAWNYFNSILS